MGGIIMNENLDLTKILKGCPEGTEFYSILHDKVFFRGIDSDSDYPVTFDSPIIAGSICLTKKGRALTQVGECIIFPSKDQRDWSKFERFWDKPKVEKFDPKTLQPFDKVLVKDYETDIWTACLYSHTANNLDDGWFVCDNTYWHYIIPYNDETKHLIGTNKDCPEYYKWWKK